MRGARNRRCTAAAVIGNNGQALSLQRMNGLELASGAGARLLADVPAGMAEVWSPDPETAARGRAVLSGWTAEMVTSRADQSLDEILDEWEEHANQLFAMHAGDVSPGDVDVSASLSMCFGDTAVHWVDLCGATDTAVDTTDPLLATAGRRHANRLLLARLGMHGLDPLTLDVTDTGEQWGAPDSPVHVSGTAFELGRVLSGRRSLDQVRSLEWSSEPGEYLVAYINGTYPSDDLYP